MSTAAYAKKHTLLVTAIALLLFFQASVAAAATFIIGEESDPSINRYTTLEELRQTVGIWDNENIIVMTQNDSSLHGSFSFGGNQAILKGAGVVSAASGYKGAFAEADGSSVTVKSDNLYFQDFNPALGIAPTQVTASQKEQQANIEEKTIPNSTIEPTVKEAQPHSVLSSQTPENKEQDKKSQKQAAKKQKKQLKKLQKEQRRTVSLTTSRGCDGEDLTAKRAATPKAAQMQDALCYSGQTQPGVVCDKKGEAVEDTPSPVLASSVETTAVGNNISQKTDEQKQQSIVSKKDKPTKKNSTEEIPVSSANNAAIISQEIKPADTTAIAEEKELQQINKEQEQIALLTTHKNPTADKMRHKKMLYDNQKELSMGNAIPLWRR